ncbi:MAG: response regulator, partial [Butyrivibrio sp.]|nr:response regulator [Butyrivibrio sp.]
FISSTAELENGWKLYYYIDRQELITDIFSIIVSNIILAVVLFIISYIIATIYARRITRRISNLNYVASKVKQGDFDVEDKDNYKDEIGQLSSSMVDMAGQLKSMLDEINKRNEQDMLVKESDIHYREWLFDFVVEKNNDILAVVGEDSFEPSFLTSNVVDILGIDLSELEADIRNLGNAQIIGETNEDNLKTAIEESVSTGAAKIIDEIKLENIKTGVQLFYRGVIVSTIDDGGKRTAIALYDRTQEFKRNHQLQEALSAAETANKAKTSFLANMSHDFRTPMNAITGFNLLIDKHSEEPDKVREYTHKISLASQNLLSLLNDVLDMSKIESGKTTLDIKEMAIGLLIEEINSVISFQAKAKNQEYIVRVEEMEHDMYMGDKQRINEILVNILGNAVKYTPEGGRIEFTIDESASSSVGFQNVRFTIKDNGIGMKPEYKDKIFDAFSREEKSSTKGIQGTGLGMAITKSLVELMGGTIRVESEEGKGSTFIVNLRLQVVNAKDIDFWTANGISRILIVDERKELFEQFNNTLGQDGVEVLEANSAYAALHVIDECYNENKAIDVILVDEVVEGMTASEIVKSIRGKDKRNNVLIFVMADDFARIEDDVKTAGANELVQKPLFVSTFKQTIEDIRNRSSVNEKVEVTNPLEGMKFLAAEDNDINADILTELMSMEGASVTRACNGEEVVEMFKQAKEGDYDMILMDIQMPIMTGYEAAAAIRSIPDEWAQRIPIIAMTANAYADDVQQAFDAGMNAHVSKPIDIKLVEKTILEFAGK